MRFTTKNIHKRTHLLRGDDAGAVRADQPALALADQAVLHLHHVLGKTSLYQQQVIINNHSIPKYFEMRKKKYEKKKLKTSGKHGEGSSPSPCPMK